MTRLRISTIAIDRAILVREQVDTETVDRYAGCFDDLPPIVVFSTEGGLLLADGLHRISAAKQLGLVDIESEVIDGDRNSAWDYALYANLRHGKPPNRKERTTIAEGLLHLHTERSDNWLAEDVGISKNTIASIRERLETACQIDNLDVLVGKDGKQYPREQYKATPQEPEIVVRSGEWWMLGTHRLFCGDSSGDNFIGECREAAFAFADPPYNAGVAEWDVNFEWRHDWLIDAAPIVAVTPGIASLQGFLANTTMPYAWSMAAWIDNGMTRGALGFGNWICVPLFARESLFRNAQDFKKISITSSDRDDAEHKGRKPLELLRHLVGLFTGEGDTVIDPFLGTGTTLIAADQLGRACVGAEIDPEYCAGIIRRWQKVSGKKAELFNANPV
jgi:16S rRNA G966 N2-methylase RsmD